MDFRQVHRYNGTPAVIRRRRWGTARLTGRALGDAGAVGQAEGGHAGASLHQEGVGMAVVAADELDDLEGNTKGRNH